MIKNLGDILLEQGVITQAVLDQALEIQNRRLGEILIQEKNIDPAKIVGALKAQAVSQSDESFLDRRPLSLSAPEIQAALATIWRLRGGADENHSSGQRADSVAGADLLDLELRLERWLLTGTAFLGAKIGQIATDTANKLEKKIRFEFSQVEASAPVANGEWMVDRRILGDLSDALMHLVRNAVDHGIESVDERKNSNPPKAEEGLIQLSLSMTPRMTMRFSLIDDGRGVDVVKVLERARDRGLTTKEDPAALTADEVRKFLFTPGFSTTDEVTDVSGHGVGLDVVEANVLRLGGSVEFNSRPEHGTFVALEVPLKFARLPVSILSQKNAAILAIDPAVKYDNIQWAFVHRSTIKDGAVGVARLDSGEIKILQTP